MRIAESLYFNMAMANLNVAVDHLRELLDVGSFATIKATFFRRVFFRGNDLTVSSVKIEDRYC